MFFWYLMKDAEHWKSDIRKSEISKEASFVISDVPIFGFVVFAGSGGIRYDKSWKNIEDVRANPQKKIRSSGESTAIGKIWTILI